MQLFNLIWLKQKLFSGPKFNFENFSVNYVFFFIKPENSHTLVVSQSYRPNVFLHKHIKCLTEAVVIGLCGQASATPPALIAGGFRLMYQS